MSKSRSSIAAMLALAAVGAWTNIATGILPDVWWLHDWRVMGPVGLILLLTAGATTVSTISGDDRPIPSRAEQQIGARAVVGNTIGEGATINTGDVTHMISHPRPPLNLIDTLGREDLLGRAERLSEDRRRRRLAATGLPPRTVEILAGSFVLSVDAALVPGPGEVRVLAGELGAGKSEAAEAVLRSALTQARSVDREPIPIWVSAQDLASGVTLESHVADQVGTQTLHGTGVLIVLDGLDERYHEISTMLTQASAFVAAWPPSRILVTTRPSTLTEGFSVRAMPLLTDREAMDLIQTVARPRDHFDDGWTSDFRELIRRPLFTLIAAQHLSKLGARTSAAQLIDLVITESAKREGEAFSTALRKIAVATTASGGPVDLRPQLSAEELDSVQRSPLLTIDGHIGRFTLAAFQQWVAAQAIVSGEVGCAEITRSMVIFDRWRYAVLVALSGAPAEQLDTTIGWLARWRPGAASWVLKEIKNSQVLSNQPILTTGTPADATQRVHAAFKAWLDGLGPVSAAFDLDGWSRNPDSDPLESIGIEAMADRHGRSVVINLTMETWHNYYRHPISHQAWPWIVTLEIIANRLSKSLSSYIVESAPEGVAETEIYRNLLSKVPELPTQMQLQKAIENLDSGRSSLPPPTSDNLSRDDLVIMLRRLKAADSASCRWPGPDQNNPTPWNPIGGYSSIRLKERAAAILVAALDAYQEIVEDLFPTLKDSLHTSVLMPATVEGDIIVHRDSWGPGNHDIWLTHWIRPGGSKNGAEITVEAENPSVRLRDVDDRLYEQFREWLDDHPEARAFAHYVRSSGATELFGPAPATALAWKWLWDDLKRAGFVDGMSAPKLV